MEDSAETRIWRYMDLAKFVSLLTTESLYFTNPREFDDPYEGVIPKATAQQFSELLQKMYDALLQHFTTGEQKKVLDGFADKVQTFLNKPTLYNVNCWHKSEYESEAMWKLYSVYGQGIAIESTIGQLKASLANKQGLIVESVRYLDFDKEEWKMLEGGPLVVVLLKRKSFEHEKELRAVITLPEVVKGTLVKCNLDTLISKIHISPSAPAYLKEVLEDLCAGKVRSLNKSVVQSQMLNVPDYRVKIDMKNVTTNNALQQIADKSGSG
jgi:hypothetical protein